MAQGRVARSLATVLFTDIVGSTSLATELGDQQWRRLLARHHSRVRRELARHGGREIDTAGDGFFAVFESPERAIRCAVAIRTALAQLSIRVRIGIHAGECEMSDAKVTGLAVVVAARVMAAADGGDILVSSTIRDLVAGSRMSFVDRGRHTLKGFTEPWHLYAFDEDGALAPKAREPLTTSPSGSPGTPGDDAASGPVADVRGLPVLVPTVGVGAADTGMSVTRILPGKHRKGRFLAACGAFLVVLGGGAVVVERGTSHLSMASLAQATSAATAATGPSATQTTSSFAGNPGTASTVDPRLVALQPADEASQGWKLVTAHPADEGEFGPGTLFLYLPDKTFPPSWAERFTGPSSTTLVCITAIYANASLAEQAFDRSRHDLSAPSDTATTQPPSIGDSSYAFFRSGPSAYDVVVAWRVGGMFGLIEVSAPTSSYANASLLEPIALRFAQEVTDRYHRQSA